MSLDEDRRLRKEIDRYPFIIFESMNFVAILHPLV